MSCHAKCCAPELVINGKSGRALRKADGRLASNQIPFIFARENSAGNAEIVFRCAEDVLEQTICKASFLIHPYGAGSLHVSWVAEDGEQGKAAELNFQGAWAERWFEEELAFKTGNRPLKNLILKIEPGASGFPESFHFTAVQFDSAVPLLPESAWKLKTDTAGKMNLADIPAANLPDDGKRQMFPPDSKAFDFSQIAGTFKPAVSQALLETTFESQKTELRMLCLSADYFFQIYLNGELQLSSCGTRAVPLMLRKGTNRLSLLCRAGSGGWNAAFSTEISGAWQELWYPHLPAKCLVSDLYPWPDRESIALDGGWKLAHTDLELVPK